MVTTPISDTSSWLAVQNMTMRFGGLLALDSVSFGISAGEIVGVIGPNGSGKTTLFNLISGRLKPDHGVIRFAGNHITGAKPHVIARLGMARTFQEVRIYRHLTVMENMLFALRRGQCESVWSAIAGKRDIIRKERAQTKIAEEWLDRVLLLDKRDRLASQLSYGQAKLLEIARALCIDPKLVLLDEPAAGLSPQGTLILHSLLEAIRTSGTTVLFIEHNLSSVREIADRVIAFGSGRLIASGVPADVIGHPAVDEAYSGHRGVYSAGT